MKITLLFSEREFEYDIYHLVQAFFPEAALRIACTDEGADFPGSAGGNVPVGQAALSPEQTEAPDLTLAVRFGETGIEATLAANVPPTGAGFGGTEFATIFRTTSPRDHADRTKTRDALKRAIYRGLADNTGRELPWGDLSGIRPVKLMTGFLDEGMSPETAQKAMMERYCTGAEKAQLALTVAQRERELLAEVDLEGGYSLYVHVPFCPSICLYCTFGSNLIDERRELVAPYLAAVTRELDQIAALVRGAPPTTIYIGGGTPTALPPGQLDALLAAVRDRFDTHAAKEWTVEAGRPDTICGETLDILAKHGVTRISVNPQTMHQRTLGVIGRGHTAEDVRRAFALARDAGFDNINMDLIVGLPGEGEHEVRETLHRIEKLDPDGITVHALALKRAARLRREADDYRAESFAASDAIMRAAKESAERMGMRPYYLYRQKQMAGNFENVGYAREGCACLYNILVMEEKQTILGAGPGAASKRICGGRKTGRHGNVKDIGEYLARVDEMCAKRAALMGPAPV